MSDDQLSGSWPSQELPASWSWIPFDQFWQDFTDSQRKLQQKNYLPTGRFAVVDQGETLIGGYTDDERLVSLSSLPAVVFGDHTRAVKFIEVPFVQGADGVRVLRSSEGIDPRFAFKALCAVNLPDKGYSRHFKFLKATRFPLPPLAEQKRIVAKLDALNAKSASARIELARIETLVSRYKQVLLSKTFSGGFSRSERRNTPGHKALPKEYANKMHPVSWTITNVGDFAENLDSKRVPVKKEDRALRQGAYPYFGASGPIDFFDDYIFDGLYLLVAEDGANLLSRSTPIAFTAVGKFWVNNHAHILRLETKADHEYLRFYLESISLAPFVTGSAQPKLTQRALSNIGVILPPPSERAEIVHRIESAFTRIDRLAVQAKRALDLVGKLDEAILAKAFRGELVPQDDNDEPAEKLLERIRAERAAAPKVKRGRGRKA